MKLEQVKFSAIKVGQDFFDRYYSGDWCVKVSDTAAHPYGIDMPMDYSFSPDSVVEVQQ